MKSWSQRTKTEKAVIITAAGIVVIGGTIAASHAIASSGAVLITKKGTILIGKAALAYAAKISAC